MNHLDAFLAAAADLDDRDLADELCCVFARDLTVRVYTEAVCSRAPAALWNLWPESKDPWGPVTACVKVGIGAVVPDLVPGKWHRVQGWRGVPFGRNPDGSLVTGHTITVYAGPSGMALVCDSAKAPRNARATMVRWSDYVAQYTGGVRIAVLA